MERRSRRASLHRGELLAQRKNFQLERYAAAEGVTESGEDEKSCRWHAGEGIRRSAERPRILCDTRFSGGTGLDRGLILHKLIEEVLTGETAETVPTFEAQAESLIRELGRTVEKDAALGLNPAELAGCVVRALSLPEIAAIRSGLLAEFPVYASWAAETEEEALVGIADAITLDPEGRARIVVDWKSDVDPSPETVQHYRAQVGTYLDMTGAERGLVVMMTSGRVVKINGRG